jgi:hypothetical protein
VPQKEIRKTGCEVTTSCYDINKINRNFIETNTKQHLVVYLREFLAMS